MTNQDYKHSGFFFEAMYLINNPQGRVLRLNDVVIVHPTEKSQSREPYIAVIVSKFINWTVDPGFEICTTVPGKHSAVMNEYLFERLEPIKWAWKKNQKKQKIKILKPVEICTTSNPTN